MNGQKLKELGINYLHVSILPDRENDFHICFKVNDSKFFTYIMVKSLNDLEIEIVKEVCKNTPPALPKDK